MTFFYLGKAPKAPGTVGTLGAVPVVILLHSVGSDLFYIVTAFLFCLVSIIIIHIYEKRSRTHDAGEIVLDEVAGYIISMALLPLTWQSLLFAFLLFRFFDILKPFPIGMLDKKIQGGLGVMADDMAAGIVVNLILQAVYAKTTWLGVQLVQGS